MRVFSVFLIAIGLCFHNVLSQKHTQVQLNEFQKKYIDSLAAHWNIEKRPGGAIGILHKNDILYVRAFGYANVAEEKKNTLKTAFQLAQVSENFLVYALLKLEQQGKLSLNDPINKHIAELPLFTSKITLNHLLMQSSGLHDYEILKHIVGWGEQAFFNGQDAINLIKTQKKLIFEPGTEFSYSRTNLFMVSIILEKVSKMKLSDFLHNSIFKPLGMKNTFVLHASNQKNKIMATSYRIIANDSVVPIEPHVETYCAINIASSIEDMVKWEMYLQKPTKNDSELIKKFKSYVQLKNGAHYSVPMGKLTYGQKYVHKERGLETAMVTGGIDGYASTIFNFPTEDFNIVVLSNNGEGYNGYVGMLSAHLLLEEKFPEPMTTNFELLKTEQLDYNYHKKYEGYYWDALGELSRELRIENDTLRYVRSNGYTSTLIPLSKDLFQMKTEFDDKIYLSFEDKNDTISMQYKIGEATPFHFMKYTPVVLNEEHLNQEYIGDYYCNALGVGFSLKADANKLKTKNPKFEEILLTPITDKIFTTDQWYLRSIEFQFNKNGAGVEGFYVRNDAIKNLWFEKL